MKTEQRVEGDEQISLVFPFHYKTGRGQVFMSSTTCVGAPSAGKMFLGIFFFSTFCPLIQFSHIWQISRMNFLNSTKLA